MSSAKKIRLDRLLLDKGLCESRAQAQALIMNGQIQVDGHIITKAGTLTALTAALTVESGLRYVSRGGLKLEKALAVFQIDATGKHCLDVGASTGGFTDCLLQNGADRVLALDVGTNQLAWSLRMDARVAVFEKTHINKLSLEVCHEALGGLPELAVIDTSFISLSKVLPSTVALLAPQADIMALIKPQFEFRDYGPSENSNFKGVVRDAKDHERIISRLLEDLRQQLPPCEVLGLDFSPITGPKGNIEFLLHLRQGVSASATLTGHNLQARIQEVVRESHEATP
jgi:23S rRNA (cytidine1920-2'-O)/16S rRNA (cytidine1409-2'-O)-methyltransferase